MNLIELHMLQSFPVSCLNRDDVGAPKSAVFGGVQRARVSSQCWKRAIRCYAQQEGSGMFEGQRTRFVVRALQDAFASRELSPEDSHQLALVVAEAIGKVADPEKGNVKTLLYFSPLELDAIADAMLEQPYSDALLALRDEGAAKKDQAKATKELNKMATKAGKSMAAHAKDAADIAIFGRMVADDHTLSVEGAGLFSHALSTHSSRNEIDFFSAVDDKNTADGGAGHIGTIEFNSACYYRYVGLNLDLLVENLGDDFTDDERKQATGSFLRAAVMAVPPARKNSMFGFNPPQHVLALRRSGQPLSLVNAFEEPIRATGNGFVEASQERMSAHWASLKELYNLSSDVEATLPPADLNGLLDLLA